MLNGSLLADVADRLAEYESEALEAVNKSMKVVKVITGTGSPEAQRNHYKPS